MAGMELAAFLQRLTPVLSVLLAALALDIGLRLFGGLRDRIDPLLGLPAALADFLQRKLNRPERTLSVRRQRSLIAFVILLVLGLGFGWALQHLGTRVPEIAPLLWFLCLHATTPWTTGIELRKAATPAQAMEIFIRRRLPLAAPINDMHGAARHYLVETARLWARGAVSPIFWGLLVALLHGPTLFAAVLVTTLGEAERVLRQEGARSASFLIPFAGAEAIANFVPARIAALLLALAAIFTPGARPVAAIRGMFAHAEIFAHANDGWPVAATAGALRVALQGDGKAWVGMKDATARADKGDILRGLWLHATATGLLMLILAALLLLSLAV